MSLSVWEMLELRGWCTGFARGWITGWIRGWTGYAAGGARDTLAEPERPVLLVALADEFGRPPRAARVAWLERGDREPLHLWLTKVVLRREEAARRRLEDDLVALSGDDDPWNGSAGRLQGLRLAVLDILRARFGDDAPPEAIPLLRPTGRLRDLLDLHRDVLDAADLAAAMAAVRRESELSAPVA